MKGKKDGMDCGSHWYLDGIFIAAGILYFLEGWGLLGEFSISKYLPPWAFLFFLMGIKMFKMHHS